MRHGEGYELLPMLGTREPPSGLQPFVKRRGRQRRQQAKDGEPRRPSANLLQSSLGDAGRVVVHAEDKRGDGINVALGQPIEDGGVLARLVEAFFYVGKIGRIDGFHADEDPFASGGCNQIDKLLIAQADWR